MHDYDDFQLPRARTIWTWAVGIILALILFNVIAYFTGALWYQRVQSPIERQNQNHDPNWLRQVETDYQTSYADFQAAQQALPTKVAAVENFKKVHGASSTWDYPTQQQYQSLYNDAMGTYQAEVTEAAHYNALASNADTGPVRPAGLPTSLTPDAQPTIP